MHLTGICMLSNNQMVVMHTAWFGQVLCPATEKVSKGPGWVLLLCITMENHQFVARFWVAAEKPFVSDSTPHAREDHPLS